MKGLSWNRAGLDTGVEMPDSNSDLTLEGLGTLLRDHIVAASAQFAEVRSQFAEVGRRIDDLRGEVGIAATIVRDLTQIVARHDDEIHEHRRQMRETYSRMEQHDARIEEMTRDIRRILDTMERRGGDGGRRDE